MTDRTPKPLEQYQHFKGGRYQVLCLAEKEDTGETLVIYQAMYGEGKIYARSLASFTSLVDPAKYPAVSQQYRFLRVLPPEEDACAAMQTELQERSETVAEEVPMATVFAEGSSVPEQEQTALPAKENAAGEDATASENSRAAEGAVPSPQETNSSEDLLQETDSYEEVLLLDPAVEQFLDAERMEQKLDALTRARGRLTDDMIDIMATSMGIEIEPGPIQERYEDLKGCLLTISRYELDRTRFRH